MIRYKVYDKIQILIDIPADFDDRIIPENTEGIIIECYNNPEGYAVDLAIPNDKLVGEFEYENVVLTPEQFRPLDNELSLELNVVDRARI